jgi:hypothetical protein
MSLLPDTPAATNSSTTTTSTVPVLSLHLQTDQMTFGSYLLHQLLAGLSHAGTGVWLLHDVLLIHTMPAVMHVHVAASLTLLQV